MKIIIIGPIGSGKKTLGSLIASKHGLNYVNGDLLISNQALHKASTGLMLSEFERNHWIENIIRELRLEKAILGASILHKSDRKKIIRSIPEIKFVQLLAPSRVLTERLQSQGNLSRLKLLDYQLTTLEVLTADEPGKIYDASRDEEKLLRDVTLDFFIR